MQTQISTPKLHKYSLAPKLLIAIFTFLVMSLGGVFGQGAENFSNIPAATSSYANRTWTGNNGVTWSATDARTDQTVNSKAILIRNGSLTFGLTNAQSTSGISSLSLNAKAPFGSPDVGALQLVVNGSVISSKSTSGATTSSIVSYTWSDINVTNISTIVINQTVVSARIAIDDIQWTNYSPTPTVTGAATAAAFTTTFGTASTAQSFSVSGSNLTANLVATAPTGFEVSSNGTSYGSTATFSQTGGSASGTLYIRLSASAAVGSYNSQNIVLSSTGATSVNISTPSSGNEVTCTTGTYTGSSGGNWSTSSNWCGGSVPTSATNVTIPTGVTVTLDAATTTVANLTIDGTLEVAAGNQLTVDGTLTNNGIITLKTGATLDPGSSYAQAGNGVYNVEQYITGAGDATPSGRFWYVGSPVASATSNVYDAAGSNVVKGWNEAGNAWAEITDNTTSLAIGKGYYIRAGADATLNFTGGAFNDGAQSINLTRTGTTNSSRGFNLVSNPYPSYLDWDGVTRSSGVSSTIWYRTANALNVNVFDTYNASAGTGTNTNGAGALTQYIPPMQSYWVFVTPNNTTGTISFDNADRSHYQSGAQGLRSTAQDFPMYLRLNVEQGTNRDQIILYMKPEASSAYDEFDSDKMFLSGTPQLYTKIADKKLVINGMKSNKKQTSVPLFIDIPSTGLFTLHAEEFNVEDGLILLEDKQEQMMQDITLNDTYTFYATAGVCSNRFVIHFKMPNAVPTAQGPSNNWADDQTVFNEVGDVQITSDARGKVVITLEQTEDVKVEGVVQVTDANGRMVYNGALEGVQSTIQLNVPSGIYYLSVQTGNITENKKVFIQD